MRKEIIGNITRVFNDIPLDLDFINSDIVLKYINFVFEGNNVDQFTKEELQAICLNNVKITIQTVDNNGKNID